MGKTTSQNLNLVFAYFKMIKPHSSNREMGFLNTFHGYLLVWGEPIYNIFKLLDISFSEVNSR
jgi:hypothetical protein